MEHIKTTTDKSTKWSKPNRKAKAWWTKDMSILKYNLAESRRKARSVLASEELRGHEMEARKAWRKAIRDQKWKYWEETFKTATPSTPLQRIKAADNKKATMSLPAIQGVVDFLGKSAILRDAFFPANVDIPEPLPPKFLLEPFTNLSDTHRTITPDEVAKYLRQARKQSPQGADGITYEMLTHINIVQPALLATVFDALLS